MLHDVALRIEQPERRGARTRPFRPPYSKFAGRAARPRRGSPSSIHSYLKTRPFSPSFDLTPFASWGRTWPSGANKVVGRPHRRTLPDLAATTSRTTPSFARYRVLGRRICPGRSRVSSGSGSPSRPRSPTCGAPLWRRRRPRRRAAPLLAPADSPMCLSSPPTSPGVSRSRWHRALRASGRGALSPPSGWPRSFARSS